MGWKLEVVHQPLIEFLPHMKSVNVDKIFSHHLNQLLRFLQCSCSDKMNTGKLLTSLSLSMMPVWTLASLILPPSLDIV
jgi:hypothetical protein